MPKKEKIFPIDTVGGRIQHKRHELGISRSKLYDLVYNISEKDSDAGSESSKEKTVLNWESNKTQLNYDTLKAMCKILHCSSDYLLGLDECSNKNYQFIHDKTGLSENAIKGIKKIKKETENWKKDYKNPRYNDMKTLNFILKNNGLLSRILHAFQNLINSSYCVPVHFENEQFVVPKNSYEYTPPTKSPISSDEFSELYWLLLTHSKDDPNDNISIALSESFFQSIALKDIEHTFIDLMQIYKENQNKDSK